MERAPGITLAFHFLPARWPDPEPLTLAADGQRETALPDHWASRW